jgi:ligand-binding sensor domain-containing protein
MIRLFCIAITILFSFYGSGQSLPESYYFKTWREQGGIQPRINPGTQTMLIDHVGRMWVGTTTGLYTYDGKRFSRAGGDHPLLRLLEEVYITALFLDKDNYLWIGTFDRGAFRCHLETFHIDHFRFETQSDCTLADNRILCFGEDALGQIWISTHQQGICLFTKSLDCPFKRVKPDKSPDLEKSTAHFPNIIQSIVQDPDDPNKLWLGSMRGLWCYSSKEDSLSVFHLESNGIVNGLNDANSIRDMIIVPSGKIWMGTWGGGLWSFDREQGKFDNYVLGEGAFKDNNFLKVDLLNTNQILLATHNVGLVRYDISKKSFQILEEVKALPGYDFPATFMIHNKVLWFVTANGRKYVTNTGLSGLRLHRFSFGDVYKSALAADGSLWVISFYTCCLYQVDENGQVLNQHCPERLKIEPGERFNDIVIDKYGDIWVIGNYRIFKWKDGLLRSMEWPDLKKINIPHTTFLAGDVDFSGNLWLGTTWEGLLKINTNTGTLTKFLKGDDDKSVVHSFWIQDVHTDHTGDVWYATEKGYGKFQSKSQTFLNFPFYSKNTTHADLEMKRVTSITTSLDGKILLGSGDRGIGVKTTYKLDESMRLYTKDDGLRGDRIYQIAASNVDPNWVAVYSEAGVSIIHVDSNKVINLGIELGIEYIRSIHWKDKDLIITTGLGIICLNPLEIVNPVLPAKIFVESVSVSGIPITVSSNIFPIQLPHFQHYENSMEVAIRSNELLYQDLIRYSFKLEGLEVDWSPASDVGTVQFRGLPAGTYQLKVRIRHEGEAWQDEIALMAFEILPVFYKRAWFIGLVVLFISGILYAFYIYRMSQVKIAMKLKNEFDQQVATSEMKALRAQMNPHFLFNSLNSIKIFIIEHKSAEAAKYLNKFAKLMGAILENSELSLVSLDKELDALQLYIELERLRFADQFDFRIDIPDGLDLGEYAIPPLVLQPFVENAIWHGLLPKKDAKQLHIKLTVDNEQLSILIEDNGVGVKAAESKKTAFGRTKSMGSKITTKRIDLANKINGPFIEIQVDDLTVPNTEITGTRVRIILLKKIVAVTS